jgi:uncharacterized Zn finger protein
MDADVQALQQALRSRWTQPVGTKAQRYVDQFWNRVRRERSLTADVEGNHGTYHVSISVKDGTLTSACSCYIGKHGGCHHCAALGATFLKDAGSFTIIVPTPLAAVSDPDSLRAYLDSVTLDELVQQLRQNGITQKAFAESIGMSSRHLSAVKSAEKRNRYFHELGATKLACLWVLEHLG